MVLLNFLRPQNWATPPEKKGENVEISMFSRFLRFKNIKIEMQYFQGFQKLKNQKLKPFVLKMY